MQYAQQRLSCWDQTLPCSPGELWRPDPAVWRALLGLQALSFSLGLGSSSLGPQAAAIKGCRSHTYEQANSAGCTGARLGRKLLICPSWLCSSLVGGGTGTEPHCHSWGLGQAHSRCPGCKERLSWQSPSSAGRDVWGAGTQLCSSCSFTLLPSCDPGVSLALFTCLAPKHHPPPTCSPISHSEFW